MENNAFNAMTIDNFNLLYNKIGDHFQKLKRMNLNFIELFGNIYIGFHF